MWIFLTCLMCCVKTLRGTGFQWKVFDNIVSFDRELLTKLASGNPQVYISQIRHCFFIKSCFKGFQVLGRFSGKTQTFHQSIKNIVSFLAKIFLSEAMSLTYLGGTAFEELLIWMAIQCSKAFRILGAESSKYSKEELLMLIMWLFNCQCFFTYKWRFCWCPISFVHKY